MTESNVVVIIILVVCLPLAWVAGWQLRELYEWWKNL